MKFPSEFVIEKTLVISHVYEKLICSILALTKHATMRYAMPKRAMYLDIPLGICYTCTNFRQTHSHENNSEFYQLSFPHESTHSHEQQKVSLLKMACSYFRLNTLLHRLSYYEIIYIYRIKNFIIQSRNNIKNIVLFVRFMNLSRMFQYAMGESKLHVCYY